MSLSEMVYEQDMTLEIVDELKKLGRCVEFAPAPVFAVCNKTYECRTVSFTPGSTAAENAKIISDSFPCCTIYVMKYFVYLMPLAAPKLRFATV